MDCEARSSWLVVASFTPTAPRPLFSRTLTAESEVRESAAGAALPTRRESHRPGSLLQTTERSLQ